MAMTGKATRAICLAVLVAKGVRTASSMTVQTRGRGMHKPNASLMSFQKKATTWTEDFEGGTPNAPPSTWTNLASSYYHTGSECYGGSGACWHFTSCMAGGDLFSLVPIPSECSSSACTLTYEYKGKVLAGYDADGVKGSSHGWWAYNNAAIPPGTDWQTRTVTGVTFGGQHLMFETYSVNCDSYLDNICVTNEGTSSCFSPTPSSGGAAGGAAAVGDPHLQNVLGERFDLMKPGKHVLINIPRGMTAGNALLHVQADARQLGGHCADMYFQELNVTGSWAEANQAGGYHYSVSQSAVETPQWVAFGKVDLKVVHGRTDSGLRYLNVYVKHLGRAGFAVGGLLGEDDHEDVVVPPGACDKKMSLLEYAQGGRKAPSVPSVAEASLE